MTYGVVHHFKGGTKDQYEKALAAVHPSGTTLPEGQLYHFAGPSVDGWTIVAIHDSKDTWEAFRDSTLLPRLQAGIEGSFSGPPEESTFDVANEFKST